MSSDNDNVVKIRNTMYGHLSGDSSCGNCIDLDTWTKENTSKLNVPLEYSHVDIDSEPGKVYAEKHNVEGIPATEICEIYQSGKEDCRNYIGPDLVKEKLSPYIKTPAPTPTVTPTPTTVPSKGPVDKEVT